MFRRINKQLVVPIARALREAPKRWAQALVRWLSKLSARGARTLRPQGGFVLPTAVLLTIAIGLFVGAILVQSFSRTSEVASSRDRDRVDNVAEPAIDRAKAKLEALFIDPRRTLGVPNEGLLLSALNNTDADGDGKVDIDIGVPGAADDLNVELVNGVDPYTLPDETRLDVDNNNGPDNAWFFESDLDGDGNPETIVYSITLLRNNNGQNLDSSDVNKANNSVVRTGPINVGTGFGNASTLAAACPAALVPTGGWTPIGTARFRKNFQVNVFVQNGNPNNPTVSAFEFQQDREVTQGNAFGVWFRYDLVISPGPNVQFNLNGAVHTDGSLFSWNNSVRYFLVSAPNSCIYTDEGSAITLAETLGRQADGTVVPIYQSQIVAIDDGGGNKQVTQDEVIDLFPSNGAAPDLNDTTTQSLNALTDSVVGTLQFGPNESQSLPAAANPFTLDPIELFTRNRLRSRGLNTQPLVTPLDGGDPAPAYDTSVRDVANYDNVSPGVSDRIFNFEEDQPFVDDTYRADDRWGPAPSYGFNGRFDIPPGLAGEPIADNFPITSQAVGSPQELLSNSAPPGDPEAIGLDGYWERRSYDQGARLIVGQRLELGNANGWLFDGDGDGNPNTVEVGGSITTNDPRDRTYGDDPLNPPPLDGDPDAFTPPTQDGMDQRPNEYRQQRALRDNLAAVQAGVYYHLGEDRDFPMACLALTAHPGTLTTINNSTTFNNNIGDPANSIDIDFLTGTGTNGWEFEPPGGVANDTAFGNLIENPNTPLRRALDNLAHFSGDPDGAFPPLQEAFGGIQHPYPQLTMWGDFSSLRRALDEVDRPGVDYQDLSIADHSTLHTASCLLGMLAYNLDTINDRFERFVDGNSSNAEIGNLANVGNRVTRLLNGNCTNGNREIIDPVLYTNGSQDCPTGGPPNDSLFGPRADTTIGGIQTNNTGSDWNDPNPNTVIPGLCPPGTDGPGFTPGCDEPEVYALFTPEQILDLDGTFSQAQIDDITARLRFIAQGSQVLRDRTFGFNRGAAPALNTAGPVNWTPATGLTDPSQIGFPSDAVIRSSCDPDIFSPYGNNRRESIGLALLFCRSDSLTPKYPSLYYLFPVASHEHDGTLFDGTTSFQQPPEEPYINDPEIDDGIGTTDINDNVMYEVVADLDNDVEDGTEDSLAAIALQPRTPTANCNSGGWCLPFRDNFDSPDTGNVNFNANGIISVNGNSNISRNTPNRVLFNGQDYFPVFLDKGMLNGRQVMALRVLNIDLDILRSRGAANVNNNQAANGESWLPNSGLIYAFREDAIREDGIARPTAAGVTYNMCDEESELLNGASCRMDPRVPRDPPVNDVSGVSTKPVDFITDPDRRIHGFRLANGLRLGREGTTDGMSFISDNPVYILGNFNDHTQEEFTEPLDFADDNYANFYTRDVLNVAFARSDANNVNAANTDQWRPAEILADAITVLSGNYCDGTIESGIRRTADANITGLNTNTSFCLSSYLDQNLRGRTSNEVTFLLENGAQSPTDTTAPSDEPIFVDRNGVLLYDDNASGGINLFPYGSNLASGNDYNELTQGQFTGGGLTRPLNNARTTRVNAVIVSGINPARVNDTYGGLHNFPRFNETWQGDDLRLQGSLVQLNFSTQDTAGFDMRDTFDPPLNNSNATPGTVFPFYFPPGRRWGYDPALQYVPASPAVARLFVTGSPRSEVFQRVDVTDPYIVNLRCAVGALDPNSPACS